jgi:hypothetical protein
LVLVGQSRRLATPLTGRERRVMATVGVVVALAVVAIGAWLATHDSSPVSRDGCLNVIVAGSLGGQLLHECGAAARSLCANEKGHDDALAATVLPACREAGIRVARSGTQ